jgi:hypothetical protein
MSGMFDFFVGNGSFFINVAAQRKVDSSWDKNQGIVVSN